MPVLGRVSLLDTQRTIFGAGPSAFPHAVEQLAQLTRACGCRVAGFALDAAAEHVVYLLHGMGIDTGIDLNALVDAGAYISGVLGRPPQSRVAVAMLNMQAA